ncbi:MAG TPA: hypothetical protein VGQ94_07640 [Terriglobales bacterium]|nr:hypothetical protein [Terriglobales bacterium]
MPASSSEPLYGKVRKSILSGLLLGLLCLGSSGSSFAQSITVSLGGGSVQWNNSFGNALLGGSATNPGSNSITITSVWSLSPAHARLALYAYFNNASAALVHNSAVCTTGCLDIPSSAVELKMNAGAFTPVTGTGPFGAAGASLVLLDIKITGANKNSSSNNVLSFNINLSSLPQLPADSYSGTLFIQAQATP